jgi:hypothetical protein
MDGVLNTSTMIGGAKVHPKLMRRLATITHTTKCGIVLSSTWRLDEKYFSYLLDELSRPVNVDDNKTSAPIVVGSTPVMPVQRRLRKDGTFGAVQGAVEIQRASEILSWLDSHAKKQQRWAILDDLDLVSAILASEETGDMAQRLGGHVVRTNRESGLTEKNVKEATQILCGD